MKIIGLTGSIGMGKSTTANMLVEMGIPVHSADEAVHRLLGADGTAVEAVAEAFPATLKDNVIDRKALGALVFQDEVALKKLESILHPLVRADSRQWLKVQTAPVVVLDIPLLFEVDRAGECDQVWVVSASAETQRARVLARPGMTEARFSQILAKQLPDEEKRKRADIVIPTDMGLDVTRKYLQQALSSLGPV